jgi:hypothetical protein
MSPQRLQNGLVELGRRMYDPAFVQRRRERFFELLRASGHYRAARANLPVN